MQKEITSGGSLFDDRGHLTQSGWAKQPLLAYDRGRIRVSPLRIKEWDYYEIVNPDYGIALLLYDIGYQGRAVVKWMDFGQGTFEEHGATLWFTKGNMALPASSTTGDAVFERGDIVWRCLRSPGGRRTLSFVFPSFRGGQGISGEITLTSPEDHDTMVNVIPFDKPSQFVYAQKINCMVPDGEVLLAGEKRCFTRANHSHGCLDWSRAVFPYHVEWRWCTVSGIVGGVPFGINIDYGFGTESSKSMIFHDGTGHHLDKAHYEFDLQRPMAPWRFADNEGRIDLTLTPVCLEQGGTDFVVLKMKLLKAYGFFAGRVGLDGGTEVRITKEDRLFGSAEAVVNYW